MLLHKSALKNYNFLAFISPWLIGYLFLFLGPLLASFYLSFTNFDGLNFPKFIAADNYLRLISDPNLYASLKVTFIFAFFNLAIGTCLAIIFALLLNTNIKARGLFRTLLYIPTVVPLVASSVTWVWIFKKIQEPSMLSDPNLALPALIIISMWSLGNPMIIYLSGLQNIPQSLYEAADIDAANDLQKFWHVTLPSLRPVVLFNLVIGIIQVFQYFVPAYVMTSGGL